MVTGFLLVGLTVACRLLSQNYHVWNLVPAGAVAIYAGARLPRKWAWVAPLLGMFVSDLFLGYGSRWPLFGLTRWTVYGTLAATTVMGFVARRKKVAPWMLAGLSVSASVLFFVTTNFATWTEGEYYPMTWSGLATCYVMAIPFFWNTLAADLFGTCALFGVGYALERAAPGVVRSWRAVATAKPETADSNEVA
jgi:hypothetical protein